MGLLAVVGNDSDGIVHVATLGDLAGVDVGSDIANPFHGLLGVDWASKRVILSMDRTSYIDSAAVGWLIMCHREFKKAGGAFALYRVPESVRQVLTLLRIDKLLPIAATESAARAALEAESGARVSKTL